MRDQALSLESHVSSRKDLARVRMTVGSRHESARYVWLLSLINKALEAGVNQTFRKPSTHYRHVRSL